MTDSIIYDMAEQTQGSPSIFLRKYWLQILDNQNNSYAGSQCVIETSALANNNKYLNYREAYLSVPLLLTLTSGIATGNPFAPATATSSADWAVGLKNWYGSVIHSVSIDLQGTTISQQTSFANMWNSFKLLTTLSFNDVITQGPSIGFYPDTAAAFGFETDASPSGIGTFNNCNNGAAITTTGTFNQMATSNEGLLQRQLYWNFDPEGLTLAAADTFESLISKANLNNSYKSYIFQKVNGVATTTPGVWQAAIMATIKLKHIHNFFEKIPLVKGVFLRITLTLNQPTVQFASSAAGANLTVSSVSVPSGGISPLMIASAIASSGSVAAFPVNTGGTYLLSLAVGATCLNSTQLGLAGVQQSPLSRSVQLYVPAYSFAPMFESAYLSSPVKNIVYTDIYQYLVQNVSAGANINQLITNGISSLVSVLTIPFYTAAANVPGTPLDPILSPFDPAGSGTTSPLCLLGNYNVVISGQNAIYNTQMRSFEAFNHHLYGCNSTNGGQTDGLCSGLIGSFDFETSYCYYYVNVSRALEIEQAVPKSISIVGTNYSSKAVNLYVFAEYKVSVGLNLLTGERTA